MSDTTVSLRRKIDSTGDLQSVVRTMKALAVSSIGQYEQSVRVFASLYNDNEWGYSARLVDFAEFMAGKGLLTEKE